VSNLSLPGLAWEKFHFGMSLERENPPLASSRVLLKFFFIFSEMLTNDLTHGFAVDNLAMDDTEEVARPRSGSVPAVQFADDSDRDSDKEVSEIILCQ